MAKQASRRLNLMLSQVAADNLDTLQKMTRTSSRTRVIQQALSFYHLLEMERQKGNRLFLRDEEGNEREVLILF